MFAYFTLLKRSRGLRRWGAESNVGNTSIKWFFTRWGAERFIEMHSYDKYEIVR